MASHGCRAAGQARRHDEAFNAQDAEGRRAIEAPDIEAVFPGGLVLRGPEHTLGITMAFWEALPDARIVEDNLVVAGETVVAEGTLTGTHTGTFRGPQGDIPATGNPVRLRYASVKQIRDGKVRGSTSISTSWSSSNRLGCSLPQGRELYRPHDCRGCVVFGWRKSSLLPRGWVTWLPPGNRGGPSSSTAPVRLPPPIGTPERYQALRWCRYRAVTSLVRPRRPQRRS